MAKTYRDKKKFQRKRKPSSVTCWMHYLDDYYRDHPCTYKKYLKRKRRTKTRQAMREGKAPPRFKKSDNVTYWMDW